MRVGELFLLGFQGRTLPGWLKEFEARFGLGGVILFDYSCTKKAFDNNIFGKSQLQELCAEIHALPSKPLIYVDQEGGKVRRLKESCGFTALPDQHALSAMPTAEKKEVLLACYREMHETGIDFNLAPVIDLHDSNNPNIGAVKRAYANDITENVLLLNEVAEATKIGLCLKHYPGIGGAGVDSHAELMDLSAALNETEENLFYQLAPRIFTNAILLSHAIVRQWDPHLPVSISPIAITRLRERLPDTLLFTDDLQMQGLQKRCSTEEACLSALKAGIDVLCIGNNLQNEEARMMGIAARIEQEIATSETLALAYKNALARVQHRKQLLQSPPAVAIEPA